MTEVAIKTDALNRVAQKYLDAVYRSICARTVRATKDDRAQSRGLLVALETIIGRDDALRLIERVHEDGHDYGLGIDAMLYDFWTLDRP